MPHAPVAARRATARRCSPTAVDCRRPASTSSPASSPACASSRCASPRTSTPTSATRPGTFAPTAVAWGTDNRTCALRLVGHGPSLRIECRVPGGDANPYLAVAALVAGGLHGVEQELPLPDAFVGNAYAVEAPARAVDAPRGSRALVGRAASPASVFGDDVVDHYANTRARRARGVRRGSDDWELYPGLRAPVSSPRLDGRGRGDHGRRQRHRPRHRPPARGRRARRWSIVDIDDDDRQGRRRRGRRRVRACRRDRGSRRSTRIFARPRRAVRSVDIVVQQRGDLPARRRLHPHHRPRRVAPRARGQPHVGVPVLPCGDPVHAAPGQGLDHQHRVVRRHDGLGDLADLVHRVEGRRARDDAGSSACSSRARASASTRSARGR